MVDKTPVEKAPSDKSKSDEVRDASPQFDTKEKGYESDNRTGTEMSTSPYRSPYPAINPMTAEEVGKPVFIPPPNVNNDAVKRNLEKHSGALNQLKSDAEKAKRDKK